MKGKCIAKCGACQVNFLIRSNSESFLALIVVFRSESCQKPLKLISFADVMGRNPTPPNVANPNLTTPSNQATPNLATTPNQTTPDAATRNLTAPSNQASPSILVQSSNLGTSSVKTSFNLEVSPNLTMACKLVSTTANLVTSPNFATTTPNVAASLNVATPNVAATTFSIASSTSVAAQAQQCSPGNAHNPSLVFIILCFYISWLRVSVLYTP